MIDPDKIYAVVEKCGLEWADKKAAYEMFSDLTKYVTMQNLFHDGGFSNTGVSQEIISKFSK